MKTRRQQSILLTIVCIMMSLTALEAQNFPSEFWHEGWVVTDEGDTVKGEIKYDLADDLVQMKVDDRLNAFSSRKIIYLEFYDRTNENYRQFYSLPYAVNYEYKVPMLFELLYEGPLSLLTREAIVQETLPAMPGYAMGGYGYGQTRQRLAYTYYFLDEKGNVRLYNGKKPELQTAMRDHWSEVKSFIKKNHLSADKMRDLVRIVAFYDSVK